MPQYNLKEESRKSLLTGKELTFKAIQVGCMMRIVDALELLVTDMDRVKKDIKYYQELANDLKQALNDAENVLKVERGHKTRLKNKVKDLQQQITDLELKKLTGTKIL